MMSVATIFCVFSMTCRRFAVLRLRDFLFTTFADIGTQQEYSKHGPF